MSYSRTGACLVGVVSCALVFLGSAQNELYDEFHDLDGLQLCLGLMAGLRSEWNSSTCYGKLPVDLWAYMTAEGTDSNVQSDALFLRANCSINSRDIEVLELITSENHTLSDSVSAASGTVISQTKHARTYVGADAFTLEAFCADDGIEQVNFVDVAVSNISEIGQTTSRRRMQGTLRSEAFQAHEVAKLISGLGDIGCSHTKGEGQTMCFFSDSFDFWGQAKSLQDSGELPEVDVVSDLPMGWYRPGNDEGSAMIELAYDIASGADYKFISADLGEQTFADDLGDLAPSIGCDVTVDDVVYFSEPAFSDGVIAKAVDKAVDFGNLHFTSASNGGLGLRFTSDFECSTSFKIPGDRFWCGGNSGGIAMHVFHPEKTSGYRYLMGLSSTTAGTLHLHYDENQASDKSIVLYLAIYYYDPESHKLRQTSYSFRQSSSSSVESITYAPKEGYQYYLQIMHHSFEASDIKTDFLLVNTMDKHGDEAFGFKGSSDGSMFGHACASSSISVAAMEWIKSMKSAEDTVQRLPACLHDAQIYCCGRDIGGEKSMLK